MRFSISKAQFFKGHQLIAWVGGLSLILFCISGILHPLMSWTGPKAAEFRPPQAVFTAENALQMTATLQKYQIDAAMSVKLVPAPSPYKVLLQVSQAPYEPRRYFELAMQQELPGYDQTYAAWLARHYTGYKSVGHKSGEHVAVSDIQFQTEFDNAYPSVNRLLPVYKVTFADDEHTSTYIYTELGVLAGLTNTYKTRLQTLFRWLHTWSWLGSESVAQFVAMLMVMSSVVFMVFSGIYLVFRFKRSRSVASQKIHRYLGAALWLPLSFFVVSGCYHLIYTKIASPTVALKSPPPIALSSLEFPADFTLPDGAFSQVSLIHFKQPYLRMSRVTSDTENTRQARFKGMQSEGRPEYINVASGEVETFSEKQLASYLIDVHKIEGDGNETGLSSILSLDLITAFGSGYDFRNKRLPVWRGTLADGSYIFVDTASGFQVDTASPADQLEGLSFSFLHKYNFLTPLTGRFIRDIVMVAILSLVVILAFFGYWRLYRRS